jgi:hypothetical protein
MCIGTGKKYIKQRNNKDFSRQNIVLDAPSIKSQMQGQTWKMMLQAQNTC